MHDQFSDLTATDDDVLVVEVDDDTLLFWLLMAKRHGRTVDEEAGVYLNEFMRREAWKTGGLDPEDISPEALRAYRTADGEGSGRRGSQSGSQATDERE